jgi:hypothetical protein
MQNQEQKLNYTISEYLRAIFEGLQGDCAEPLLSIGAVLGDGTAPASAYPLLKATGGRLGLPDPEISFVDPAQGAPAEAAPQLPRFGRVAEARGLDIDGNELDRSDDGSGPYAGLPPGASLTSRLRLEFVVSRASMFDLRSALLLSPVAPEVSSLTGQFVVAQYKLMSALFAKTDDAASGAGVRSGITLGARPAEGSEAGSMSAAGRKRAAPSPGKPAPAVSAARAAGVGFGRRSKKAHGIQFDGEDSD